MENQDIDAIEIAAGQADYLIDSAVATANQPEHIIPIVDIVDGGNNSLNETRKVTLKCVVEDCEFQTSKCDSERY